jgi:formylglycine-generating enzyme
MRVAPGTFSMGRPLEPLPAALTEGMAHRRTGDPDEHPRHDVTLTHAYYMASTPVTNAQYEKFDPGHRSLRGRLGFSSGDDEAVVFVSWHDATAYCAWLAERVGVACRLPTEAEWEYACRAATDAPFWSGDTPPDGSLLNARESWYPDPARSDPGDVVGLRVGGTPANPWGLHDMHGLVEEWCRDYHAPYPAEPQRDPSGPRDGAARVTRGGSHSTVAYYLRAANRMAALPDDRHWLLGFRVAIGETPSPPAARRPATRRWQTRVRQACATAAEAVTAPIFREPRQYVHIPSGSMGPLFSAHNHVPAIAACPNGDLLAVWYSCVSERGRELTVAASRRRAGDAEWDPADQFWGVADRNNHAPALLVGGDTIHHFNGLGAAATWGALACVMRSSTDSGVTWSDPRLIMPEHTARQMPIESVLRMSSGALVLPCDAVTGGEGGSALWVSRDDGASWRDPGGTIAGIHAAVAERADGSLMALGRGDNVDGRMPMGVSTDMGRTWRVTASRFPPISGGQRCVLLRLREGPLLFASFTGPRRDQPSMEIRDESRGSRPVRGLFASISHDDGQTWPHTRLVSDDGPDRELESMDGQPFTMGFADGEPLGYLAVCQATGGMVHLISSRQHYEFNAAWLAAPAPSRPATNWRRRPAPLRERHDAARPHGTVLRKRWGQYAQRRDVATGTLHAPSARWTPTGSRCQPRRGR